MPITVDDGFDGEFVGVEDGLLQAEQATWHLAHRPRHRTGHVHVAEEFEEGIVGHVGHRAAVGAVDVEGTAQVAHHVFDNVGGVIRPHHVHVLADGDAPLHKVIHLLPHGLMTVVACFGLPDRKRRDGVFARAVSLPVGQVFLGVGNADGDVAEDFVELVRDGAVVNGLGPGVAAGVLFGGVLAQPFGDLREEVLSLVFGFEHPREVVDAGNSHVEGAVDLGGVVGGIFDDPGAVGVAPFDVGHV